MSKAYDEYIERVENFCFNDARKRGLSEADARAFARKEAADTRAAGDARMAATSARAAATPARAPQPAAVVPIRPARPAAQPAARPTPPPETASERILRLQGIDTGKRPLLQALKFPARNQADVARLFGWTHAQGGNVIPFLEQIEAGTVTQEAAEMRIAFMVARCPKAIRSQGSIEVSAREMCQLARMAIENPKFPDQLEAACRLMDSLAGGAR